MAPSFKLKPLFTFLLAPDYKWSLTDVSCDSQDAPKGEFQADEIQVQKLLLLNPALGEDPALGQCSCSSLPQNN